MTLIDNLGPGLFNIPKVKMSDLVEDRLVPDGTYNMRVHKAEYVAFPKSGSGNPYIKVTHVITGPDSEFVGRMVFMYYTIKGKGTQRLHELLKATGHDPDTFELEYERPDHLIGREFTAVVATQKGNGDWPNKNVVKQHLPLLG